MNTTRDTASESSGRPSRELSTLLNPDVASRLKNLELRARLVVEGFIAGLHKSPYHGFSVEFAEHRQYMPGDPVHTLDWKVFGKTDRYYVKEFEEETNLKCYLIIDCSGSMGYGSGRTTKFDYAQSLAAALVYLMLHQRDAAGITAFADKVIANIPARSASNHLYVLLRELVGLHTGAVTDAAPVLHVMAEKIKRRGLVILLSDLLTDPGRVISGLKHFRHKRHEVIVFQILDRQEREFAFPGAARFEDMETGELLPTLPAQIRAAYRGQMNDMIARYKRECRESLVDYHLLDTSVPFDRALYAYLGKRAKMY
jgi:uncharacterized protein (DUF58 family)